jgi:hypothetical protein
MQEKVKICIQIHIISPNWALRRFLMDNDFFSTLFTCLAYLKFRIDQIFSLVSVSKIRVAKWKETPDNAKMRPKCQIMQKMQKYKIYVKCNDAPKYEKKTGLLYMQLHISASSVINTFY